MRWGHSQIWNRTYRKNFRQRRLVMRIGIHLRYQRKERIGKSSMRRGEYTSQYPRGRWALTFKQLKISVPSARSLIIFKNSIHSKVILLRRHIKHNLRSRTFWSHKNNQIPNSNSNRSTSFLSLQEIVSLSLRNNYMHCTKLITKHTIRIPKTKNSWLIISN